MLLARVHPILAQDRGETIVIVESNQPREVYVAWDFDSFGPQDLVEGREMQRLGIDDRPVEVEYNRPNHVRTMLATPAPPLEAVTPIILD
jgi:hypothetical protein